MPTASSITNLHEVIVGGTVIAILLMWSRLPRKVRIIPAHW
ncbi:hypothetical protein [Mycobacterium canetti]|nr:hypothetical protein [Mycobacterium canetti]